MECRCGAEMEDIGTAMGGYYLRWCPKCGRLHQRGMNPSLPGGHWIEPSDSFGALLSFIETVNTTGGLMEDPEGSGNHVPVADDTWVDLADAYLKACAVMSQKPKIEEKP